MLEAVQDVILENHWLVLLQQEQDHTAQVLLGWGMAVPMAGGWN